MKIDLSNKSLEQKSLEQVSELLYQGSITKEEAIEYIKAWNAGPHMTQAMLSFDGSKIINFDPENKNYRHYKRPEITEMFGIRWD